MLFITYSVVLISLIASRIGVMYPAQIAEEEPADRVISELPHPYTKALLSATPLVSGQIGIERIYLKCEISDPANPIRGCRLHPRCPLVPKSATTENHH